MILKLVHAREVQVGCFLYDIPGLGPTGIEEIVQTAVQPNGQVLLNETILHPDDYVVVAS